MGDRCADAKSPGEQGDRERAVWAQLEQKPDKAEWGILQPFLQGPS